MENNYLLCGVVVKVLEEKKTYTPPHPFIILKKWNNESKEEASY